jgi:hypothetical protein
MLGNHPELNKDSSGYFLEASSKTSSADKLGLNRKTILIGKKSEIIFFVLDKSLRKGSCAEVISSRGLVSPLCSYNSNTPGLQERSNKLGGSMVSLTVRESNLSIREGEDIVIKPKIDK